MKKIILIFVICLLVCGCGKTEKNITINIYENSDTGVKEEQKQAVEEEINVVENQESQEISVQSNNQQQSTNNEIEQDQSNTHVNNDEQSTLDKVTDKVKDTYNSAKDWYNTNKDELKDINSGIIENDKKIIEGWIDSGKSWYEENKDELKNSTEEIYNNDKETIEDLYNKIKN